MINFFMIAILVLYDNFKIQIGAIFSAFSTKLSHSGFEYSESFIGFNKSEFGPLRPCFIHTANYIGLDVVLAKRLYYWYNNLYQRV